MGCANNPDQSQRRDLACQSEFAGRYKSWRTAENLNTANLNTANNDQ